VKPGTIKGIRTRLGLTQDEAGKLFGCGPRAFHKYETGEVKPSGGMQRLLYCADKFPTMLGVLGVAIAIGKFDADEGDEDEPNGSEQ
jgi:HTH-type transcriptional regulator/antitoxin MqsA